MHRGWRAAKLAGVGAIAVSSGTEIQRALAATISTGIEDTLRDLLDYPTRLAPEDGADYAVPRAPWTGAATAVVGPALGMVSTGVYTAGVLRIYDAPRALSARAFGVYTGAVVIACGALALARDGVHIRTDHLYHGTQRVGVVRRAVPVADYVRGQREPRPCLADIQVRRAT